MRIFKFLILVAFMVILPVLALADDGAIVAPAGLEWLGPIVQFVLGIPKVGPIVAAVLAIVSLISGVMTALSVFVQTVLKLPELVARWAGAVAFADKVKAFADKILPFLKYLSMFNVQKP